MNLKISFVAGIFLACAHSALAETQYSVQILPAPPGASIVRAESINDSGLVAGRGFYPASGTTPYRGSAILWQKGTFNELPLPDGYRSGEAFDINRSGQIAGIVSLLNIDSPGNRTVRWDNGSPVDINSSDNSGRQAYELGINDSGDVAGNQLLPNGSSGGFAVIGGTVFDLGFSKATSINNAATVVGIGAQTGPNTNDSAYVWTAA